MQYIVNDNNLACIFPKYGNLKQFRIIGSNDPCYTSSAAIKDLKRTRPHDDDDWNMTKS